MNLWTNFIPAHCNFKSYINCIFCLADTPISLMDLPKVDVPPFSVLFLQSKWSEVQGKTLKCFSLRLFVRGNSLTNVPLMDLPKVGVQFLLSFCNPNGTKSKYGKLHLYIQKITLDYKLINELWSFGKYL